jgi:DNA-binding PadR family transcriptional regulator
MEDSVQQEVVLAMLAKEPSSGSRLRARLNDALGPLGDAVNDGQIYVTLSRLESAGFIARQEAGVPEAGRKAYELTAAGQERVAEWLAEVSWPRPDLAEFHLKLVAAAQAGLRWPNPMTHRPGSCSKASCCVCRPTCAGWRRANASG